MNIRYWFMILVLTVLAFGIAFDLAFALAAYIPDSRPVSAQTSPASVRFRSPTQTLHTPDRLDTAL